MPESGSIINTLLQVALEIGLLMIIVGRLEAGRRKNEVDHDALGVKVLAEKVAKFSEVEQKLERTTQDLEAVKAKLAEQVTNNTALSQVLKDQDRKIQEQTIDIQELKRKEIELANEVRQHRDDNVQKSMIISTLQNERDIATARYEAITTLLGRIDITVSQIKVENEVKSES